ncbi:hypothetical protein C8F04DRAFT_963607 [Mycena alexandri]|uniref:Uncharacterized protein n=1 Tax=Mycena alexandri TaxID=1745969 RepID=A0AAD6SL83_9AGAR|nr:hypothetical protein C8F04DRAFT_963607 [Mycena alexandri]
MDADSAATGGITLDLPADTPPWLRSVLSYLTAIDLGCHYTSLLTALVRLEESAGFEQEGQPLPSSKLRPGEVQKWIRGARGNRMKCLPEVVNVAQYGKTWNAWWDALQPSWRKRGSDGHWVVGGKYGAEYGALDASGLNGCISIVAALYFWGTARTHDEGSRAEWERAVQDVVWMLEGVDTLFE